jgi:virginiamycin B lyase
LGCRRSAPADPPPAVQKEEQPGAKPWPTLEPQVQSQDQPPTKSRSRSRQHSVGEILSRSPTRGQAELGAYVASINLSSGETWPYKLKTQPRPTGKSTQAIITTYDLPESAAPHDTLLDKAGNVWFSDFQHHVISKLDPKTGKVTRYPVPLSKPGFPTGGLMITMDKDGNIWEAVMGQAQIAKLDPKTEKVSIYLAPDWNKGDTRFTMIDALHSDVDGKLWTKTNGGPEPDHSNKLYQFDITTEKFHEVLPPTGKRDIAAYGLVTDLDNNVYGLDNNPDQRQIWRTNAKTGETTYIDLPLGVGGARRGHIDSHNRLWFSRFHANSYAMYDPETGRVTQWEVPVAYAGAYDVQFDEAGYAWGADMSTDLVQRLNVETGEWSSYLRRLPSIRAISMCRRVRLPTSSPACGPKASRRAKLSTLSR